MECVSQLITNKNKAGANFIREYENSSTTNNSNFENNIALSLATLMINIHISFALERNRSIEKYLESFTKYMKAMAFINFQTNLSF